jgi:hypothetical protein
MFGALLQVVKLGADIVQALQACAEFFGLRVAFGVALAVVSYASACGAVLCAVHGLRSC